MSVTQAGTPATAGLTTSGSGTVLTGAGTATTWGTGQNRTAGSLLVAVVTAFGSTSAAATAQNTGTSGWTKGPEFGAGTATLAAIWTKPATGGDAVPVFTSSISGTSARTRISSTLYELTDGSGFAPVLQAQNTAGTGTSGTLTVTTSANVAAAGEYGIAAESATSGSTGTNTWGTSGSWANTVDGASTYGHWVTAVWASPTSGATASYAPTHTITTTAEAGVIAVFSVSGGATVTPATLAVTTAKPAVIRPAVPATLAVTAASGTPAEFSQALEVYGFGTFAALAGKSINSVTVTITEHQGNAAQPAVMFELWDYSATPARIGPAQYGTASTSGANTSSATWTGLIIFPQLDTLRVRVYGRATGTGTGYTESVDAVSLSVNYSPSPGTTIYPEPPVAITAGYPAPAVSVITAGRPVGYARQVRPLAQAASGFAAFT